MPLAILLSTLKGILWSFVGEKVIAKFVWWFLEKAAKYTTNGIDDELVQLAKRQYYNIQTPPAESPQPNP